MCEFSSWVEERGKIYFLTPAQVFNTRRGRELQEWSQNIQDDIKGHGAIRYYYGLDSGEGKDGDCADFSNPENFPREIIDAVKKGAMKGMLFPLGLIIGVLEDEYKAKLTVLEEDYDVKREALDGGYETKRRQLYENYEAKRKQLDEDENYKTKRDQLYADYWKELTALKENHKTERTALEEDYNTTREVLDNDYWDIFMKQENRTPAWK